MSAPPTFDYIVIGAGSAGCIVANRLVTLGRSRVLLVEAGDDTSSIYLRMPAGFAFASKQPRFDWGLVSEKEPGLGGRTMPCPRGKVVGGSSAVNAMAFVRGNRQDFDRWAEIAGPEWSYEACLPAFKSIETFSGGEDRFRGGSGPLHVRAPDYSNPLYEKFLGACVEAGYRVSDDTNGAEQEGFGPMDQTIHAGFRTSAATAFLDPVRSAPGLTFRSGCRAEHIVFEGRRAVGAVLRGPAGRQTVRAEREVILCAGAIHSPHLLMLSGIGPADHLKSVGITPVLDLPMVGANLKDHVDISLRQSCPVPITESLALRLDRRILIGLEWMLFKTGKGTTNHFEVAGYIRTRQHDAVPNIQLCFMPLLVAYDGAPKMSSRHGFQISIMLLRPKSSGRVELAGADPERPPRLIFNYLAEPDDVAQLQEGLWATRAILSRPSMSPYAGDEIAPGAAVKTPADAESYIRRTAKSTITRAERAPWDGSRNRRSSTPRDACTERRGCASSMRRSCPPSRAATSTRRP